MMTPLSTDSPLKSIANYQNFGLRPAWIELYAEEREEIKNSLAIGPNMITSARIWFRQSYLCKDSKTFEPGKLLDLVKSSGSEDDFLWTLLWIALVNNSPLLKWFVTTVPFDQNTSQDELDALLGTIVSPSAKRGGLQALKDLLKNSPLSSGINPLVKLATKGRQITGITRLRRSIDPLAVLYSLYVMAQAAGRTSFTISEMMNNDFEAKYISPIVAFGMEVDEFKGQCLGVAGRYPKFLSCNFTLGLDEVRLFTDEKNLEDVTALILGE